MSLNGAFSADWRNDVNADRESVGVEVVVTVGGRVVSTGSVDTRSGSASRGETIGD